MATASRATGAHPCLDLTPAERAVVAAELAGLSDRVGNLAARLERLHTAPGRAGPVRRDNPDGCGTDHRGFRRTRRARRAGLGHGHGGYAMAVTREQLLADPHSGARPLSRDEQADRARLAEVAAQWFPATSPFGRRCEVQVSDPVSSMTCAAPGGASASPATSPSPRRCEV